MTKPPIQIRNPEVVRDIRALADRMGVPLTQAVADAVRRRLAEEGGKASASQEARRKAVREAVRKFQALPRTGRLLTDADLYDDSGLPR